MNDVVLHAWPRQGGAALIRLFVELFSSHSSFNVRDPTPARAAAPLSHRAAKAAPRPSSSSTLSSDSSPPSHPPRCLWNFFQPATRLDSLRPAAACCCVLQGDSGMDRDGSHSRPQFRFFNF